jgi:hypothetical protein
MATAAKVLDTGDRRVSAGRWMHAWVHAVPGRLELTTRLWTRNELTGFRGGVRVALSARDGALLFQTPLRQHGVDGTWIPAAPSSASAEEAFVLPEGVFEQTDRIDVALGHAGKQLLLQSAPTVLRWLAAAAVEGACHQGDQAEETGNDLDFAMVQGLVPAPVPPPLPRATIVPSVVSAQRPTTVTVTVVDAADDGAALSGDVHVAWTTPLDLVGETTRVGPIGAKLPLRLEGRWIEGKHAAGARPSYVWTCERVFAVVPGLDPVEVLVTVTDLPARPAPAPVVPPLAHV